MLYIIDPNLNISIFWTNEGNVFPDYLPFDNDLSFIEMDWKWQWINNNTEFVKLFLTDDYLIDNHPPKLIKIVKNNKNYYYQFVKKIGHLGNNKDKNKSLWVVEYVIDKWCTYYFNIHNKLGGEKVFFNRKTEHRLALRNVSQSNWYMDEVKDLKWQVKTYDVMPHTLSQDTGVSVSTFTDRNRKTDVIQFDNKPKMTFIPFTFKYLTANLYHGSNLRERANSSNGWEINNYTLTVNSSNPDVQVISYTLQHDGLYIRTQGEGQTTFTIYGDVNWSIFQAYYVDFLFPGNVDLIPIILANGDSDSIHKIRHTNNYPYEATGSGGGRSTTRINDSVYGWITRILWTTITWFNWQFGLWSRNINTHINGFEIEANVTKYSLDYPISNIGTITLKMLDNYYLKNNRWTYAVFKSDVLTYKDTNGNYVMEKFRFHDAGDGTQNIRDIPKNAFIVVPILDVDDLNYFCNMYELALASDMFINLVETMIPPSSFIKGVKKKVFDNFPYNLNVSEYSTATPDAYNNIVCWDGGGSPNMYKVLWFINYDELEDDIYDIGLSFLNMTNQDEWWNSAKNVMNWSTHPLSISPQFYAYKWIGFADWITCDIFDLNNCNFTLKWSINNKMFIRKSPAIINENYQRDLYLKAFLWEETRCKPIFNSQYANWLENNKNTENTQLSNYNRIRTVSEQQARNNLINRGVKTLLGGFDMEENATSGWDERVGRWRNFNTGRFQSNYSYGIDVVPSPANLAMGGINAMTQYQNDMIGIDLNYQVFTSNMYNTINNMKEGSSLYASPPYLEQAFDIEYIWKVQEKILTEDSQKKVIAHFFKYGAIVNKWGEYWHYKVYKYITC